MSEFVLVKKEELERISAWLDSNVSLVSMGFDSPPEPETAFDMELIDAARTLTEMAEGQKQEADPENLRFTSACELDGPKHPEYVKGWEAAMDAMCKLMDGAKPRAWEDDEGCLHTTLESATFSSKHATPLYAGIPPVQNHEIGEVVVTKTEDG